MAKALVVVESPSKAKTINKYLGPDYEVIASVGHIKDLPKKGIGIDFDKQFEPTYEVIPGKEKVIRQLKSAAKDADTIYVATDPDREGEAIGWHIKEELEGRGKNRKTVRRVLFNEITKSAIQESFKHPTEIDQNLVDAQQARRLLDRIVGYQVSPLLWDKVRRGLSAGRVQSVALRLVVERERDILAFVPTEYWTITANLSAKLPPAFDARLFRIDEKTVKTSDFGEDLKKNEVHVKEEKQASEILAELKSQSFIVSSVTTREKKRNPVPPFITSKLQQEASRKLRFPVKKTMQLAQKLYEGIETGKEGLVGLITYMRTDSTRVADSALSEVREMIGSQFGAEYMPDKPIHYRSKKDAQDAHEAIRPTSVYRTPDSVAPYLGKDELALYKLIWQRFVASQMMAAVFDQTTIDIKAGPRYLFRATGAVLKFNGFLAVYEEGKDEKDEDDEEQALKLPRVEQGEQLKLNKLVPDQHFTEPPPRFTEATLVKALEEKGIGRPSTYASIMTVIQDREYAERKEGRFRPTELGIIVNDLLVESFDDLFNVQYTAHMEEELDEIEEGKMPWTRALAEFYEKFTKDLESARVHMRDVKRQEIITDEKCENCGSNMAMKFGRYGQFLACTNYPDCKTTRDIPKIHDEAGEEAHAEAAEETCETCGKPMAMKRGRFGQFLACTGYPDCKTTRKIQKGGKLAAPDVVLEELCPQCGKHLIVKQGRFGPFTACSNYPGCKYIKQETTGVSCPEDGGELIVKKGKYGKSFYGCSNYPKCKFALWDKPVAQPCPECGARFLVEKVNKAGERSLQCRNEDCKFKQALPDSPPGDEDRTRLTA
ncbi:MAG TPA: type I DNA topoisomerase [Blastocatellia bacterium]|jgi:DNA topoisomerase-1|nr:type I DNA topoisomerase [Blastocatellia bacterium]